MKLGFTGTQAGMTQAQFDFVQSFLHQHKPSEFHHGDCIGADDEAQFFAQEAGVPLVVVHPPENPHKRAYSRKLRGYASELEFRKTRPYLDRNHAIVDESDELLAAPNSYEESASPRSGTWSTVRYARKAGKPVTIVFPDGSVVKQTEAYTARTGGSR